MSVLMGLVVVSCVMSWVFVFCMSKEIDDINKRHADLALKVNPMIDDDDFIIKPDR